MAWLIAYLASPAGDFYSGTRDHDRRRPRQLVRRLAARRRRRRGRRAAEGGAQGGLGFARPRYNPARPWDAGSQSSPVWQALALAAPSGAVAQEQCLFQGVTASAARAGKVERSLLCLTNVHRIRNGVGALQRDTRLTAAARAHSDDMVVRDYFDHVNPEGNGPSERVRAAGYPSGAGENIASNSTGTAFSLFDQWRDSSGHNQNMLSSNYDAAGFGVAQGMPGRQRGGVTGTQDFGSAGANTGDTALGLYASSPKCAKAKMRRMKAKGKKRKAAKRQVKRRCKPVGSG